jgi:hypothetical protein
MYRYLLEVRCTDLQRLCLVREREVVGRRVEG